MLPLATLVLSLGWLLLKAPGLEFFLTSPDHGYQIGLGQQVLFGKFPYIDLWFHYGPMVAFSSAAGIYLSNSLIGEVVICALGYALCAFLMYLLVEPHTSRRTAALAALVTVLSLARFYKWYYWLFPLIALYLIQRVIRPVRPPIAWVWASGIGCGVAALFRLDMGIACLATVAATLTAREWNIRQPAPSTIRHLVVLLGGFAVVVGAWLTLLALVGGWSAVRDYAQLTIGGASGIVSNWSLPWPHFRITHPLSPNAGVNLLAAAMLLGYGTAIFRGLRAVFGRREMPADEWFLFSAAMLGIAVSPQFLYSPDPQHLLQIIPPFIAVMLVTLHNAWAPATGDRRFRRPLSLIAALLAILGGIAIKDFAGQDLTAGFTNPIRKFGELADARSPGGYQNQWLSAFIAGITGPDDRVLVVPVAPQLYYFAHRPMSGATHVFIMGNFDDRQRRLENLGRIMKHPPRIVIVAPDFFSNRGTYFFKNRQELYQYITRTYTRILSKGKGWMVLARNE